MDIAIDRDSRVPIYRQIVHNIRDMIRAGRLPEGFQLPPERRLAQALGVNRSTILSAYRELKGEGLVDAHVGRGTVVLARPWKEFTATEYRTLPWRQLLREGASRNQDPVLRDLLEVTERHEVISLSIGLPAPEVLPLETLGEILVRLVAEVGPALLMNTPTEGHTPLRECLTQWIATRGISCTTAEVAVLSGSQQGLDLVTRLFIDPGDVVVVEEPTYLGALPVFRRAQARVLGVPTDDQGMCVDVLETVLERHRPKLIYTLPTYQNPSGTVLSLERRHRLLELAYRHQVPILEDDPYSELRYEGDPIPSLRALDRSGHVLYLSTFSKILSPGMRLGWMIAPRQVARQLTLVKQSVDLNTNSLAQMLLDRFIRDGHLAPYLLTARAAYARRRGVMEAALQDRAPADLTWRTPAGGFYFWCRLPDDVEQAALFARAAEDGVSYLPGSSCFADDSPEPWMRLSFSYAPPDQLRMGVTRLLEALDQVTSLASAPRRELTGTAPIV